MCSSHAVRLQCHHWRVSSALGYSSRGLWIISSIELFVMLPAHPRISVCPTHQHLPLSFAIGYSSRGLSSLSSV